MTGRKWDVISTGTINTNEEIDDALDQPLVKKLIDLIRLRNDQPAFSGDFKVDAPEDHLLELRWDQDEQWVRLQVDFFCPVRGHHRLRP